MNGLTSRELQIIGLDGLSKLAVGSNGNLVSNAEQTNGAAKSTKALLMAGTNGTLQIPLLTDDEGRIVTTSEVVSQLPAFKEFLRQVAAVGQVVFGEYTLASNLAIKEFHIGGKVACEGTLALYHPDSVQVISGFNSSGDVSAWANTGIGDGALAVWSYATDQFIEGTGAAKVTFTKSDANNYPEITYTFPTPLDLSSWRYVKAVARVTVAAGGNQTRKVQIRLTSGTAVRIWEVSGNTTTAPFSTEQWHYISGQIESPTATGGTGVFDINNVTSISLRLLDGGNKTGTLWWDDVKFMSEIAILEKIYSSNGSTEQLRFDPVIVFDTGDVILMTIKNNGTVSAEVQASASGVAI